MSDPKNPTASAKPGRDVETIIGEMMKYIHVPEIVIIYHKPFGYAMLEWGVQISDIARPKLKGVEGIANAGRSSLTELLEAALKEVKKNFPQIND